METNNSNKCNESLKIFDFDNEKDFKCNIRPLQLPDKRRIGIINNWFNIRCYS